MIYKTLHRQLKIEEHEPHKAPWVDLVDSGLKHPYHIINNMSLEKNPEKNFIRKSCIHEWKCRTLHMMSGCETVAHEP